MNEGIRAYLLPLVSFVGIAVVVFVTVLIMEIREARKKRKGDKHMEEIRDMLRREKDE